jgi:hydroxymethylbilane synthase
LIIGSRGSKLALAQTNWVKERILDRFPDAGVDVKVIRVSADADAEGSIRAGTARGVFVREIDEALLAGAIDLAVHSCKDVPSRIPEGLEIRIIPEREDARDALITPAGGTLEGLPAGALVGTGSVRRQAQVLRLRPDLRVAEIRGNVDTRLRKLDQGDYGAIVLACAGLRRLGLAGRIGSIFSLDQMLPAPGQGALAIATRAGDQRALEMLATLHDPASGQAVAAERAVLRRLGGGCNSPIAVHAALADGIVRIEGLVSSPDGRRAVRDAVARPAEEAEEAGVALAETLLASGGSEILAALR